MGELNPFLGDSELQKLGHRGVILRSLVSPDVKEQEIQIGDFILAAKPQPIGTIYLELLRVGRIVDGAEIGCGLFFIAKDEELYFSSLDSTLNLIHPFKRSPIPYVLDDAAAAPENVFDLSYHNSVLSFTFQRPASVASGILSPGGAMKINDYTVSLDVFDSGFSLQQVILNGPDGDFTLPGLRRIDDRILSFLKTGFPNTSAA